MKKRNIIVILAAIVLSVFTSCNKWLDISPEDEISAKDMFKTTEGFYNVLNGIYLSIGSPEMYGGSLSWKEMEGWGQGYALDKDYSEHKGMYALTRRDYRHEKVESLGDVIWSNAYKNIARVNMFLQYADKKSDDFWKHGIVEKHVLVGEALAIRAYLHFDLLRIFADNPVLNKDGVFIPFVDKYPSFPNPPMKSSEVAARIVADLEQASQYLAEYDLEDANHDFVISQTSRFAKTAMPDWGRFYSQRGSHMNYYAIRLLQARVALYTGNYEKALEYAGEFIQLEKDNKIDFLSAYSIGKSPKFMDETFFAFHYDKLIEATQDWFDRTKPQVLAVEDIANFNAIKNDKRKDMLSNGVLLMFNEDKNGSETLYIPALRFSEAYYIAAESYLKTGRLAEAITTLNVLLKARKATVLAADTTADKFLEYMINDARKEFAGMGQNVFMYKRLNEPVHFSGGKDMESVGKLTLPIPYSESVTL